MQHGPEGGLTDQWNRIEFRSGFTDTWPLDSWQSYKGNSMEKEWDFQQEVLGQLDIQMHKKWSTTSISYHIKTLFETDCRSIFVKLETIKPGKYTSKQSLWLWVR